jgi:hypothetical protein
MPDWLRDSLHQDVRVETKVLLARLAAAFVLGCVAAGVYHLTTRAPGRPGATPFLTTLVLLSVLIALVTLVIGNSVARAFSLVGALAIVRFRTIVEDTRDTAFVIFAVAAGMACGSGYLSAAVAATPLVLLAAWLFRPRAELPPEAGQRLVLRLGAVGGVEQQVQALLGKKLPGCRLVALATARAGSALDVTYATPPLGADEALALVAELSRIEGVQGVELKGG